MKPKHQARILLPFALWITVVWTAADIHGTGMAAQAPAAGQPSPQAQIEKGRVAVAQVCVGCHGGGGGGGITRMLEVRKRSAEEWRETVLSMIGRGAQVLPDEIEPITAYLVATAGRGRPPAPSGAAGAGASAVLARRCLQCHDLERATTKPASGDWNTTIDRMVTLGASLTPGERQTLIEYLTGREK